jgi:hypothetical protein
VRLLSPLVEDCLIRQRQWLDARDLAAALIYAVDLVLAFTGGDFEGGVAVEAAQSVKIPPRGPGQAVDDRTHAAPVIAKGFHVSGKPVHLSGLWHAVLEHGSISSKTGST